MSDDHMLALARASQNGGPAEALSYATALERAGRPSDALDALLPFRDSREVRRTIGRLAVHGAPLVRAPRVRWARTVDGREMVFTLSASPLGIAVASKKRLLVLDPDSGEKRHERPRDGVDLVSRDQLVELSTRQRIELRDLWTGLLEGDGSVQGSTKLVAIDGTTLVTGRRDVLRGYALGGSAVEPIWRHPLEVELTRLSVGGGMVWIPQGMDLVGIDIATGVVRCKCAALGGQVWADGDGAVVQTKQAVVALDREGQHLWRLDESQRTLVAVGPVAVVMMCVGSLSPTAPAERTVAVDRATGRPLIEWKDGYTSATCQANGVLYRVDRTARELTAVAGGSQVLFRFDLSTLTPKVPWDNMLLELSLGTATRRLYLLGHRTIYCLEG